MVAGRLYRAEINNTGTIVTGRLYRAELVIGGFVGGILYRAELDSTTVITGRLYRAEIDSADASVSVRSSLNGATAEPFYTVTLYGTGGNSSPSSLGWVQTGGPAVTLTGATTSTATFVAPAVIGGTLLNFQYHVDGAVGDVDIPVFAPSEQFFQGGVMHPLNPQWT